MRPGDRRYPTMLIRGKTSDGANAVDIRVEAGRIVAINTADASVRPDLGDESLRVAPGFVDLQINGYAGIDWNDATTSPERIAEAVRRLRATGATALYPTVITGAREHITACLAALARAMDDYPEVALACRGVHLEGPYISPEDGARGAHPAAHARRPDLDEFLRWQDACDGRIRLVTLAPEWPEALDFIERATASGVTVALGHTAAAPARIAEAVRAGAQMSTHLGNGSHSVLPRHENYIWAQLAEDDLAASFIADGHHLPPYVLKCLLRAKGAERSILVTDAIAAAGLGAGRRRLGDIEVEVSATGRVSLPGTPYLAGSVLEMHQAVANAVRFAGVALDEALRMAGLNPAKLMGIDDEFGSIETGRRADLIVFDWDACKLQLQIVAAVINGETVYKKDEQMRENNAE
jgi:N-acetylglucosamine-6-phosphate deacetylase